MNVLLILAALRAFTGPVHPADTTITTSDPARAEIVTSDVAHFWTAFDDAAKVPMDDRAAVYAREYRSGSAFLYSFSV